MRVGVLANGGTGKVGGAIAWRMMGSGCASRRAFQSAQILVHVHLKLADFIHGAFSQDGKIPGILGKHVRPQRLNGTAEVLDLVEGLLQLGFGFNHNCSGSGGIGIGANATGWA